MKTPGGTFSKRVVILSSTVMVALGATTGCGKKCRPQWYESVFTANECAQGDDYSIYLASGFPTASGGGLVTKWSPTGTFQKIIFDYNSIATSLMPQALGLKSIGGSSKLLMLAFDGTAGRVDYIDPDGSNFTPYFANGTAMAAGTRRIVASSDGGTLIARTAGVEYFNPSNQRVGAPRFATTGTCTAAAILSVTEAVIGGSKYVISLNGAANPNNKLNLYNGASGVCIAGVVPAGPATTMWPVYARYVEGESKLFVLYYPFTAATTNAQIWSFDVSSTSISNGTLLYDDTSGDIAIISATPGALSSSLAYFRNGRERFILVGTSNNSVIKLTYDGSSLTRPQTQPLIYLSAFARSIGDIFIVAN